MKRSEITPRVDIKALFVYLGMVLIALMMLGPLIALVSVSLQARPVVSGKDWFSLDLTLNNYVRVLKTSKLSRWYLNSTIATGIITVLGTFISTLSAYVFAKKEFPGKNVIFLAFISVLMFPVQSWIITMFIEFSKFGMIDTFWPFILSGSSSAFGIFLVRQYITQAVPDDILNAADIDGCGEFGKFLRIIFPMAQPAVMTLAILLFISWWSEFLFALVMVNRSDMYMLPVGITLLQDIFENSSEGIRGSMAATTLAQLPILIIFIVFNKYVMRGIAVQLK